MNFRRRILRNEVLNTLGLALWLTACSQQAAPRKDVDHAAAAPKQEVVRLDVAVFSYIERPIFDVYLNGKYVGDGGGGLITGVSVQLGAQAVTWRDAGTGETFRGANHPILSRPEKGKRYLGVHIYPDNTVELIPATYWPERTERGMAIDREQEKKHGR